MEAPSQTVHDRPGSLTSADDWLTYRDLGAMLKVSRRTLVRYVALELIPYHRINGWIIRFRRDEIEAWLFKRRRLKL